MYAMWMVKASLTFEGARWDGGNESAVDHYTPEHIAKSCTVTLSRSNAKKPRKPRKRKAKQDGADIDENKERGTDEPVSKRVPDNVQGDSRPDEIPKATGNEKNPSPQPVELGY
jgi:hypothetical protein